MPLAYHRFTVDEYHRMGEAGILTEDDRVELLDGQIVPISPIGPRHTACVKRLNRVLARFDDRAILSVQDPVVLEPHAEPEPDVALLRPRADFYERAHPKPEDIFLLIEVAETSVAFDRQLKLPVYARAKIPEVWLVNLPADQIEIYREPVGAEYANHRIAGRDATLSVRELPGIAVRAAEIL